MTELNLIENTHPRPEAMKEFDALVGIDAIKEALVDELVLILDRGRLDAWRGKHHPGGLAVLDRARSKAPVILLSGGEATPNADTAHAACRCNFLTIRGFRVRCMPP
jgi:hypothetical protein